MANCPGCGQYLAECQIREEEIKGMKILSCWKCKAVIGSQPIQSSSRSDTKVVYRESGDSSKLQNKVFCLEMDIGNIFRFIRNKNLIDEYFQFDNPDNSGSHNRILDEIIHENDFLND
jgi:hypothetical protein